MLTSLILVLMSSLRIVGPGDDAIKCSRMGGILPPTSSCSSFPESGRYRSAPTTPLVV